MNKRRYFILTIVSLFFLVAFVVTFVVLVSVGVLNGHPLATILLLLGTAISSALTFACWARFLHEKKLLDDLEARNFYRLGQRMSLLDTAQFDTKVSFLLKYHPVRKKRQFVVAFTACNQSIVQNFNRNEEITLFNAKIAEYLEKELLQEAGKQTVYCFDDGIFLLYLFSDDANLTQTIIGIIQKKLYIIADENSIRVSPQPFFGVYEVRDGDSLTSSIENALIARMVSEENYETFTYYHPSFRQEATADSVKAIREALDNREFVVYYQPKFSLNKGEFISSEALVRWQSPTLGLIPPNKFIPQAEAAGLVHQIDTYVFQRVCEDLNEMKRKGHRMLPVSVNFSLYEFYSENFLDTILHIIEEKGVDPSLIEVEITETTSQVNQFLSISTIKKLQLKGVRVLMDDFGLGYSNIGNLKKIPFDAVKIDKSFIDRIATDNKTKQIVRFLIELCKLNDMETIAEGADTKEQVDILKKAHCDTIQGFYYSKALPLDQYEKFLANNPFEKKKGGAK